MGGTESKTTIDILNEVALNVVSEQTNRCVTTSTQQQINEFSNIGGDLVIDGLNQKQYSTINATCLINNLQNTDVQQKLANELINKAETLGNILTLGKNKAEAISNIKNKINVAVKNSITNESITSSYQVQGQKVQNIGGNVYFTNVSQEQSSELIAKNIIGSSQISSVINDIGNAVDQSASSKTKGLIDFSFDSLFNGISKTIIYSLIIIAIVILGCCLISCGFSFILLLKK